MKYGTEWMTATLEDIEAFCIANAMPMTAQRVAEAVSCALVEEARIREHQAKSVALEPQS